MYLDPPPTSILVSDYSPSVSSSTASFQRVLRHEQEQRDSPLASSPASILRSKQQYQRRISFAAQQAHLEEQRQQKVDLQNDELYQPDRAEPLLEVVADFIALPPQEEDPASTMVLFGESGIGKSMFMRQLNYHLWQVGDEIGLIPVLVELASIHEPLSHLVEESLTRLCERLVGSLASLICILTNHMTGRKFPSQWRS